MFDGEGTVQVMSRLVFIRESQTSTLMILTQLFLIFLTSSCIFFPLTIHLRDSKLTLYVSFCSSSPSSSHLMSLLSVYFLIGRQEQVYQAF